MQEVWPAIPIKYPYWQEHLVIAAELRQSPETAVNGGIMIKRHLFGAMTLFALMAVVPQSVQAAEDNYKIPLKLFGSDDIKSGMAACRLSFWQHNRDPDSDRYAFLFHANQDSDGFNGPAQLKVGETFHSLDQLVYGGEPIDGHGTHYLFATYDREIKVHIELLDIEFRKDAFYFDKAKLTVFQKGKIPFTANAKGVGGCPQTAAVPKRAAAPAKPAGPALAAGIPIGTEKILNDISEIPGVLRQQIRDYASNDCDVGGQFPWGGARYVINDYYLLWQIPCFSGAYQGSGVFAVTQNPPQGWGELLTLPNPPGLEGNQNYAAMNAKVIGRTGHIETVEFSRGAGDCGVRQIFRLIDGPGEVLELELLEYREKIDCDGNAPPPEEWPLAYRMR